MILPPCPVMTQKLQLPHLFLKPETAMEEYSRTQEFHAAIASGYAFYTPGRDLEVKDIMTRADAYMYRHKRRMKR